MRFAIREATAEDSAEIARVQVDTWRTTYRGIVPQSFLDEMDYSARARSWRDQLSTADSKIFVAEVEGGVCGFVCGGRLRNTLAEFDGEIFAIYIEEGAQRRGCGSEMMRRVARAMLEDGLRSAAVWVLEENPACGFYSRLGGELVGRQRITIGGSELVEVAYGWKDLRHLTDRA
jgi:ribosomal protein S18 acetylase RimI-like enzyme